VGNIGIIKSNLKMKRFQILLSTVGAALVVWVVGQGLTWHFVPVYLCISFLILALFYGPLAKKKLLVSFVLIGLIGVSCFLFWLFPFVKFPKPSGKYAIGVRYSTVNTDRDETMTPEKNDKRTLYLKIWYPAKTGQQPNPYLEESEKSFSYLAKLVGIPSFMFSQLGKIETNSSTNAAWAEGRFPLITFSHGYGSWFGQNTVLMEELASRGYIVAAIAHSHQSIFAAANENKIVFFPRVVPVDSTATPVDSNDIEQMILNEKNSTLLNEKITSLTAQSNYTNRFATIWTNDIVSSINYLCRENLDKGSSLYSKIDTNRIGAFGMSFGGAAAVNAAMLDSRVLGAVNMDGFQYGDYFNKSITTPLLFLEARRSPYGYSLYGPYLSKSKGMAQGILFSGAEHYNFTDLNYFSPAFQWIGLLGSVAPRSMIIAMNEIVPDFFDSVFSKQTFKIEKHLVPGKKEQAVY